MYTFSQLLIRNAILGLLFSLISAALMIFMFRLYVSDKQLQQQQVVTTLAEQIIAHQDVKTLSQVLRKKNSYQRITITTQAGEQLYHFTEPDSALLSAMISPATTEINLPALDTIIAMQVTSDQEANLALKLILLYIAATAIFIIIAGVASTRRYKAFFNAINWQIKKDLSLILPDEQNSQAQSDLDLFDIPDLKAGLQEIKALIDEQKQDSVELEREAYTEPLTGLANRNQFIKHFEQKIHQSDKKVFGVLLITRCSELQTINQVRGYKEGDDYIKNIANIMKGEVARYQGGELYRLNSSDFASLLPNTTLQQAEQYAQELTLKFNDFQQAADLDSVAYSGLVAFDEKKPLGEILALADTGISVAQTQRVNAWYSQKEQDILDNTSAGYGNQNWRQEIENVIENQRVSLLVQSIQPNTRNSKVYGEVLARFLNANDDLLPTASFIAMAEKLDKITAIDQIIISKAISEIKEKNLQANHFGINVSPRSIHDQQFVIWLERKLLREPDIAPHIVFEITEYGLQQNIKTSKRFIEMLHRVGARLTVERFGVGLTSFKFFRDLKPDFIKMDSSYTRDIDEDKNNQYFIRVMVDLAHRLSISVLAESVETLEEKHTLEKLFVDGCQGFYIGKPKPM